MAEVLVTGVGVVSPFGVGRDPFVRGLAGLAEPAIGPVEALAQTTLADQRAGRIPGLEAAASLLPAKLRKFMSEAALLGCLAGREAWQAAELAGRVERDRIGLFAASGLTSASFQSASQMLAHSVDEAGRFSAARLGERGLSLVNPLDSFKILPNMPPCILSVLLGVRGPSLVFNPSEDQGAAALAEGIRAVADGEVEAALAGGADTASAPATLVFLRQYGALAEGEVASPGAAYLVLEHRRSGRSAMARLRLLPEAVGTACADPLAPRLGRTLAAAPALAVAAACLTGHEAQRFVFPGLSMTFEVDRMR
jgi:3-oxoacyl-[acyl-carrier-protein] synthase II